MTIPSGIAAVRVTGRFRRPDGTPYQGTVTFQAPVMVELEQALTVIAGRATADLDHNGEFSLLLVATDNPGMDPTGWVYTVTVVLDDGTARTGSVALSSSVTEVDITKLLPADPAQLNYVPVKGAPGASILSGPAKPTMAEGAAGDYWIDTTKTDGWLLYGPKTASGWPQSSLPLGPVTTWRVRDLPDPVTADAVHAGPPPTISAAQTSTPTPGHIKYAPAPVALAGTDRRGTFTWAGAGNFAIGVGTPDNTYVLPLSRFPNTYTSGQGNWSCEFATDSQVLQLRFKHISPSTMFRLSIDGRKVTDLMQPSGGAVAGQGLSHLLTIDFGSAAPRRLRFDFATMPFGGIYLPPTANMWEVPLQGGRFMVLGDSLSDGSAHNAGAGCGTWVDRVGRMLGCTDVWRESRGSTGYVAAGTFANFGTRAEVDVIPWAPDRLVIWGGYNDASSNQAQIAAAAATLFDRIKTALPRCQVFVIGCWSPTGNPAASLVNTTNTLRTAAANARFPFVSPQTGQIYDASGTLVATHGPWITGTGNTGALQADGNADLYIGSDGVHATDAGHIYLARRILGFLRAAMPA
ncbi:SGNH/GDSL hydrolase family protein [Streptomyces sp. WAC05292]|uniref:SGNH/GDSL hydrolase family protein n=1 Tax=Streptomyces sp. WAC05292 TaxID=2487418 RepID=UPI000F73B125|nr:SGNH/GDSL hydrolase family protein [Streptomyces sp. WAC05292]RSS97251.1 SGNH/GDSL hydrolase family protein [Streptomyces sp. WAC05292]